MGIIDPSNVMLWTKATPITNRCSHVVENWKIIVVAYTKRGECNYSIGELDTGQRTIQWTMGEEDKRSINSNLEVSVVYSKSSVSSMVNPLFNLHGKAHQGNITFSSDRISSQIFAMPGGTLHLACNQTGAYSQHKLIPFRKIKYGIGTLAKMTKGSKFKVKLGANPENCFNLASERTTMARICYP